MARKKKPKILRKIADMDAQIKILEVSFEKKNALIKEKMMVIPNIIDESVPIGKMIVKMLRFKDWRGL